MRLHMPTPVKARSRTKKVKRKARGLSCFYSSAPNGIVTTRGYESNRNLLTSIIDEKDGTTLSHKAYSYDAIARPTTRQINERSDSFSYDSKSQLTAAQLGTDNYGYAYDNIGNRKTAQEIAEEITYSTNSTNEYTAINDFTPEFDADGNQIKLQTSTGIWSVEYNAENRPISFTSEDGNTIIEAAYDYMGRRAWKKVTINGVITYHQAFIYRGYLQIAAENLIEGKRWAMHFITWDPTQPEATRPLAIEQKGTWFTYGLDLSKNITELYTAEGTIATSYQYSPFGAVEATGETANPIQWSCEIFVEELGLVYYNYRHYNPADGRWINRDRIAEEGGLNLYGFVGNRGWEMDELGEKYSNQSSAARAAIKKYSPPSLKEDIEYCGFICRKKGTQKFIYTAGKGIEDGCWPLDYPCPKCYLSIAYWHTHGAFIDKDGDGEDDRYYTERFSQADIDFAERHGVDAYVGTPKEGKVIMYDHHKNKQYLKRNWK